MDERDALTVTNAEHYSFLYPGLDYYKEVHFTWFGINAHGDMIPNGACALLYKCPLWKFLERHDITFGDYLMCNWDVANEDYRITDYVLADDPTPDFYDTPSGLSAAAWFRHVHKFFTSGDRLAMYVASGGQLP